MSWKTGRKIARDLMATDRYRQTYNRLQAEAASRPGSRQVRTPDGSVWMSPIEADLYDAMLQEGLLPVPQACIKGYVVDFAFPDVRVAVEADGASFPAGRGGSGTGSGIGSCAGRGGR